MTDLPAPIELIAAAIGDAESPLDALTTLAKIDELTADLRLMYVRRARAFGCTWPVIGEALGVSPQAVRQRFAHLVEP